MKTKFLTIQIAALSGILSLSACNQTPPPSVTEAMPAATSAGERAASAPLPMEVSALTVAGSEIKEFKTQRRENGTWTGKGCTWTVPEDRESLTVAKTDSITFDGYFLTSESSDPGEFEFVLLNGTKSFGIPVKTNYERPDVVAYFKSKDALHTGYRFSTTLESLPAGEYIVDLFYQRNGVDFFCETGKKLIVQ